MIKIRLIGFVLLAVFTLFLGCATTSTDTDIEPAAPGSPPPVVLTQTVTETLMPLTPFILQRIRSRYSDDSEFRADIGRYQFLLFGRILMEREFPRRRTELGSGGQLIFFDENIRETITINDQTGGQAIDIRFNGNEISLYVCFDQDDRLSLPFTTVVSDFETFFHLKYDQNGKMSTTGDEKGTVWYGENEFKLRYSGERSPYLLVRLSHSDLDVPIRHTAPGRMVN